MYGSVVPIAIFWPCANVQCSKVVSRTLIGHNKAPVAYLVLTLPNAHMSPMQPI